MPDELTIRATAKINLCLDILGQRDDGYHEVKMIMQTIDLYDRVRIRKTDESGIRLMSNLKYLPSDERNIAWKAAKLMFESYSLPGGIEIELTKKIPVSAGLAGGSTNAAAVLTGIDRLYELGLSQSTLMAHGLKLGADVPFCIMRGTAVSEGIGEKLRPLPEIGRTPLLLVKPAFSVSTREVYEAYDQLTDVRHPDTDAVIDGILRDDLDSVMKDMGNVLEYVTMQRHPILNKIRDDLLRNGAHHAMMSGSGPTVFGIFETDEAAKNARDELRKLYRKANVLYTHMGKAI